MRRSSAGKGFTLIEMVVTCLIIGLLAAFGVPQYLRTMESTKADDSVALVNMIGTTNKMFALDHSGWYAAGSFSSSCTGTGTCPTTVSASQDPCVLVWCNYLTDQNWAAKPYTFYACNGKVAGACGGVGGSGYNVASAMRKNTAFSPYNTWGYVMDTAGRITASGTDVPTPVY